MRYTDENERWTKAGLAGKGSPWAPGYAGGFRTSRAKLPDGAHDLITLPDGRTAQWWCAGWYALSDGTFARAGKYGGVRL